MKAGRGDNSALDQGQRAGRTGGQRSMENEAEGGKAIKLICMEGNVEEGSRYCSS